MVCSSCDHGIVYCTPACRIAGRCQAQRDAGRIHVIFGPTAGLCATTPVAQAGGGRACWETPPEDMARAGPITTCVEPPRPVQMSDPSLPDNGRPYCWTGPRFPGR